MAKHIKRAVKAALFVAAVLYMPYKVFGWIGVEAFKTQVFLAFVGSALQGVFSKGTDGGVQNFGTKFANRSAIAPRQIIYGECRVGGTIVNIRTSGTDNHKLHLLIALAGHECQSLENVSIGDTTLTTSTSGAFQMVTNSKYTNTDNDNAFASGRLIRYRFVDGSQTTADTSVRTAMPGMTTSDIGKDIAYVYVECIYDNEKFGSFPNLSFVVKGKKVFDPRNSSTAFSSNPALIIRDYLADTTYGLKAQTDELNDTTNAGGFSSAANTCDQSVTLNNVGATSNRYTCNGFTDMGANPQDVIRMLLTSCGGKLSYVDGKFQLFVAAAQTPSLTITDDDILAPPVFSTGNAESLPNAVKSVFVDSLQRYQPGDCPVEEDSTFLSEDTPTGESSANYKSILELQLPFTTNIKEAQRLQRIFLRQMRQKISVNIVTHLAFMKVQPGDWVYLTNSRLGFDQKIFEVEEVQVVPQEAEGGVFLTTELVLRENSNSVTSYTFNEYSTPSDDDDPGDSDDRSISAPSSLTGTVQSIIDGPTNKINIVTNWTNASNDNISGTEISYKLSTDSNFSGFSVMKGVDTMTIPNVSDNKTYNIKARHFTPDGIFSDYTSVINVAVAVAGNPGVPTSLSASTTLKLGIMVSWINPTDTNLRSIKLYRKTSNTTPTDDTDLIETFAGEPGKRMRVRQGIQDGLTAGTTYFFWVRSVNHLGNHSAFVGSVSGIFGAFNGGDVGLNNLNDLDPSQNTKLTGVETGATVGAKAGVNLKDSGNTVLDDVDFRNEDLAIDFTGNTTFRIKKGSTVIDTQAFDKGNVGLTDLDSLESGTGTKLSGIESGATVGAKLGTNLKDSGNNSLSDADVRNSDLVIAKNSQTLQLKKGSTLIDSVSVDKGFVGLSDLDSLESGTGTKLSGIETGATVGAVAGTNLKDSGNNTLADADVRNSDLVITKNSQDIQIKKGATLIDSVSIDKSTVGLSDLNSLQSGSGTKLAGIEANATFGAKAGTNLLDSNENNINDDDLLNSSLSIDFTGNTTLQLKKGSSVVDTQAFTKTNVGLSDLDSLEAGTGTKLSGIESGATVGARAGVNLKRNNNTVVGDADIITSEGTSDDTENVNSVAKADITGSITGAQTNVASVIQNLAAGTQSINAGSLDAGTINTSLLKLDELFLPTSGTGFSGQTVTFNSTMTQVSLGDIGTGPGFYMGTCSIQITDAQGDDIRGASLHIDIKAGVSVVYTKYWGIGQKEGNRYYDHTDQFGDSGDLPVMHLEFAYFHTASTTLSLHINGDSNDTQTTCLARARVVKFGAETVTFNPTSISAVTGATASSTQDSGTVTVSGFTGTKAVNLSGNSSALVSVNGGTFTASPGTISANQTFEIRLTASPTAGTTRSATVEIGGTAITFSVTTAGTYTPSYSGGGGSGGAGGGFETTNQIV